MNISRRHPRIPAADLHALALKHKTRRKPYPDVGVDLNRRLLLRLNSRRVALNTHNPLFGIFGKLPHSFYATRIESIDWDKSAPAPASALPVQPEIALL
jgi:hypothetical protein